MNIRTLSFHACVAWAAFALPATAQQDAAEVTPILDQGTIDAILAEGLGRSQVMEHLDGLTNVVGHRLTGSDNFTLACDWALARFREMGLEARLEPWATWPVVWNRGQWSGRVVTEGAEMELQVATPAWTPGTRGRRRGPLKRAPATEEDAARAARDVTFRGAWLWVGEESLSRRGSRPVWLEEFSRSAGVLGYVSAARGSRTYPDRIRVFGSAPVTQDYELPTMVDIVVRSDQAAVLDANTNAEAEPLVVEFDIRNRFRREPVTLHNVIAEIPGTEHPDQAVVVCGHLDSWHQATGTTDNGTGSSTTLEAARILSAIGAQPRRTIRFCLWGGEEQGLLGSGAYVKRHRSEMDSVSFVFNHDTGTNWWQNMTIDAGNYDAMARVVAPFLQMQAPDDAWTGPVFELRKTAKLSGSGGSDHASFLAARVPAASVGLEGRSDYFGYTWHTQWDTYDVAIPEYQKHTATKLALGALGVAQLPELLDHSNVEARRRGDSGRLIPALEGVLGVRFERSGPADFRKIFFREVEPADFAYRLGFREGDRLVDVADRGARLSILWRLRRYDDEYEVVVKRDGENVVIKLPPQWSSHKEDATSGEQAEGAGDGSQSGDSATEGTAAPASGGNR